MYYLLLAIILLGFIAAMIHLLSRWRQKRAIERGETVAEGAAFPVVAGECCGQHAAREKDSSSEAVCKVD